jgi:hypothetical protein
VTWFETQKGLVALNDIPHGFFKLGSVNAAIPGMSETRLVWANDAPKRLVADIEQRQVSVRSKGDRMFIPLEVCGRLKQIVSVLGSPREAKKVPLPVQLRVRPALCLAV